MKRQIYYYYYVLYMSKICPTHLLDTAIEPFPCRQTISDEKTSGMDVPTAKNDSPMTESKINQGCSLIHYLGTFLRQVLRRKALPFRKYCGLPSFYLLGETALFF